MEFVNDNFMLKNNMAKVLYEYVKKLPIIDYHCHISPQMIAEDKMFSDCYELFLGGDHYKWRQMRSNGIDEEYITGNADNFEKWLAFSKTMPKLIGNPLFHWTHLELKRYFCKKIWLFRIFSRTVTPPDADSGEKRPEFSAKGPETWG